ncbi:MAG: hypothetical protein ACLGJB_25210 [Blastocatellia bacterium]
MNSSDDGGMFSDSSPGVFAIVTIHNPTYFELKAISFDKPNKYGRDDTHIPIFYINRHNLGLGPPVKGRQLWRLFDDTKLDSFTGPKVAPTYKEGLVLKEELGIVTDASLLRVVINGALYRWPSCNSCFYKLMKSGDRYGSAYDDESTLADYQVELVGPRVKEPLYSPGGPGNDYALYYRHGYATSEYSSPGILMQVRRARVFYKDIKAFVEYRWNPGKDWDVTIRGLRYISARRMSTTIGKVKLGLAFLGLLSESRGQDKSSPLSNLYRHYDSAYWQVADMRGIAKTLQESKDETTRNAWREKLKRCNPDVPDDLVEWLSTGEIKIENFSMLCPDEYKRLNEKMAEGYSLSNTRHIALEWSARLSGAGAYFYALPTLESAHSKQIKEHLPRYQKKKRGGNGNNHKRSTMG